MLSCMPETIGRPAHLLLKAIGVALCCPRANVRFLKDLELCSCLGNFGGPEASVVAYKLSPFAMACEWKAKAAD